jgi:hypothetical protein
MSLGAMAMPRALRRDRHLTPREVRGEGGGVATADSGRWSPQSRAYCIAKSGGGVYVVGNRNDYVGLRVWNYSGSQINGVVLFLIGTTSPQICNLGNIPNNSSSGACLTYALGSASGALDLWYDWALKDTIGYDAHAP